MTPIIEKLLILQDQDLRIVKFEQDLVDIPQRKAAIDAMLNDHRQAITKAKDDLKARQADMRKAELEVESLREKISKLRSQQMQLKSNQEFKAMETEIATIEKHIRENEDQMLELMETVETAQALVKQREEELKNEEIAVKRELAVIDERAVELTRELAQAKQVRAQHAVDAEPERLAQYQRMFNKTRAKALVPVEDNGTCGGCHMKLPPYIFHNARKQTEIVACGFCGRMLY